MWLIGWTDVVVVSTKASQGDRCVASLTAGLALNSVHGGGSLIIVEPRTLVAELGPLSGRVAGLTRLVHQSDRVRLIKTRLLPPYMNTKLIVEEGQNVVVATVLA